MFETRDLLTVSEAARLLKMSPDAVRRWVREGRLKAYRVGENGPYRITMGALHDYVTRGRKD